MKKELVTWENRQHLTTIGEISTLRALDLAVRLAYILLALVDRALSAGWGAAGICRGAEGFHGSCLLTMLHASFCHANRLALIG